MVTRLEVIRAGHRGGADAERLVRQSMGASDPLVWAAAIGAAERLGVLHEDDVVGALDAEPTEVVRRGVEASARWIRDAEPSVADTVLVSAAEPSGLDRLDSALLALLAGENDALAEVAAWALGERCPETGGAPAAVAAALAVATTAHDDPLVREAAVAALGCAGVASTLPAVLAACADRATVRRRAVLALAAFEGPAVQRALETALGDRDWQVRQSAEDLLR